MSGHMTSGMFSSNTDNWGTPRRLFDALDEIFNFDLDACASPENAKCKRFFTKEDDALKKSWGGAVFCNPPYGRAIEEFVKKAAYEIKHNARVIVMLLPARTDTRWFHEYLYCKDNVEIRFIRGRLKFEGAKYNAPFPSMIAVMWRK